MPNSDVKNVVFVLCAVGMEDAIDGDKDTISDVGSIETSMDSSCDKSDQAEIDSCAKVEAIPDNGRCSPVSYICFPCNMCLSTL